MTNRFIRFIRFIRILLFLDNPQNQGGNNEEQKPVSTCEREKVTSDDIEIHVEDEVPDFLKTEDQQIDEDEDTVQTKKEESSTVVSEQALTEDVNVIDKEAQKITASLLDNRPLVKMFEECADIIKQLERIKKGFQSEDFCDVLDSVREQLIQAMNLSGGDLINDEKSFNILRHKCRRGVNAEEGDEISDTIESGISLEDRVFVKALVELKKEKNND